jgi:hypothetical protein
VPACKGRHPFLWPRSDPNVTHLFQD